MSPNLPICPQCQDSESVERIELDARSIFNPLPAGWQESIEVIRCSFCGWIEFPSEPDNPAQKAANQRPQNWYSD